jgi:hypothetical protein
MPSHKQCALNFDDFVHAVREEDNAGPDASGQIRPKHIGGLEHSKESRRKLMDDNVVTRNERAQEGIKETASCPSSRAAESHA